MDENAGGGSGGEVAAQRDGGGAALLKALRDEAVLLLIGNVDQGPSVGPGQLLAGIIASGTVPGVRLTEVFRQVAQSRIVVTARLMNGPADGNGSLGQRGHQRPGGPER